MNLMVIDVGTSSMRGIVYDRQAREICSHQIKYAVNYIDEIHIEQNPADWSRALYEITGKLAAFCREQQVAIAGLSLTCQRTSVIPVAKDGTVLRPAIMWMDKRNRELVEGLKAYEAEIIKKTGMRLSTICSGAKMLWLRKMEPEIYEKSYKLLTIADYLAFLMTGEFRTDQTYGCRSLLMNLKSGQWDDDLLQLFEINKEKLCEMIRPGTMHGYLTPEFAGLTGLPPGIPLISAGGDQQCAALGLGVIQKGRLEVTAGTGAFILAYSEQIPPLLAGDVVCGVHAKPNSYILEASILSCASLYDWFNRNFYREGDYETINQEVAASPPGANGCMVLPYFQGRGTPDWNSDITGMFANVTLNTTRQDMARAILEGIVLEIKNNLDMLTHYTQHPEQIYVSGGLTNMPVFNQLQADIYGREVVRPANCEKTAVGAWMNGAVALGLYDTIELAARGIGEEGAQIYYPDKSKHEMYERQRQKMQKIYHQVSCR